MFGRNTANKNGAASPAIVTQNADGRYDSLLSCLVFVAKSQGLDFSREQLILDNQLPNDRLAPMELVFIAQRLGMRAKVIRLAPEDLMGMRKALPAIVMLRSGGTLVLNGIDNRFNGGLIVELQDAEDETGSTITLDLARFEDAWSGEIILVKRKYNVADEDQPFSIKFITGLILQEKRFVRDVAISSIFIAIFALLPIIYFRLMTGEVMYYYAMSTYTVLTLLLVFFIAFETAFTYFRYYLLRIITTRVDARMNEYMFERLLKLPIDFFERAMVGTLTHDMREVDRIRDFMIGGLFGTVLDSVLLFFFLPLMIYFNPLLTAIVLGFCGLIVIWLIAMLPPLRATTGRLVSAQTARGSFLYQTLAGIRTVKSLALESRQRATWDQLTAEVARRDYDVGKLSAIVRTVVTPLERLAVTGSFAIGIYLAISSHDAVGIGSLYAFLMLSQRVASPLMSMAQLISQWDEARIAVDIVSKLVNRAPEERTSGPGIRKQLEGHVEFSNLKFKYQGSTVYALDGVSFDVPIGTTLGIVGRSGSGKTTVTRLLQRLHSEYEGLIKVDGADVREYDMQHLRRSLGVVLQENFLFSGTIRQNITAPKPQATFDEVVNACRMAGAEEFIDRLPRGYETMIYEGSPNLSGGQRQRLAIARALIVDPRILILDEATSALDPDSEAIVNENIRRIAEGRTMLVISHRLSSLVNSDAILVLERGKVADMGTHAELLGRCEIYSGLWNQQNRHTNGLARQTPRGPIRVS
jgi:subfamily B ATP-binding cassette protein HlyB/CyaB